MLMGLFQGIFIDNFDVPNQMFEKDITFLNKSLINNIRIRRFIKIIKILLNLVGWIKIKLPA